MWKWNNYSIKKLNVSVHNLLVLKNRKITAIKWKIFAQLFYCVIIPFYSILCTSAFLWVQDGCPWQTRPTLTYTHWWARAQEQIYCVWASTTAIWNIARIVHLRRVPDGKWKTPIFWWVFSFVVCMGLNLVFRVCVWDKKYFLDKTLKLFYNIVTQNLGATHFECVTRWW